jgi:FK506-binding protein 2
MQRLLVTVALLASAACGVLAADELGIEVTVAVECDRKTKTGDKINVHYRGTLQSNGQEFDASWCSLRPVSPCLGTTLLYESS